MPDWEAFFGGLNEISLRPSIHHFNGRCLPLIVLKFQINPIMYMFRSSLQSETKSSQAVCSAICPSLALSGEKWQNHQIEARDLKLSEILGTVGGYICETCFWPGFLHLAKIGQNWPQPWEWAKIRLEKVCKWKNIFQNIFSAAMRFKKLRGISCSVFSKVSILSNKVYVHVNFLIKREIFSFT